MYPHWRGINRTVSGDYETTQGWTTFTASPGVEDLWFKIDEESEQAFKKMLDRYKKKLSTLVLEDNDFDNTTSTHLKQVLTCLKGQVASDEDTVVLDT